MTPAEMLEQRICRRLADLALEMENDPLKVWRRYPLPSLTADSFKVLHDIHKPDNAAAAKAAMALIEQTVNDNTHQQVRDTQGSFAFGDNHLDMYEGSVHLMTFNADAPLTSQQRYAALMVIQHFESLIKAIPAKKSGRLQLAGTIVGGAYGITQAPSFDEFAYTVNGALGKHALPEKKWSKVVFMTLTNGRNPAP